MSIRTGLIHALPRMHSMWMIIHKCIHVEISEEFPVAVMFLEVGTRDEAKKKKCTG